MGISSNNALPNFALQINLKKYVKKREEKIIIYW